MPSLVVVWDKFVTSCNIEFSSVVAPVDSVPVVIDEFNRNFPFFYWESISLASCVPLREVLDKWEIGLYVRYDMSAVVWFFQEVDCDQSQAGNVVYSEGKEACVNVKTLSGV